MLTDDPAVTRTIVGVTSERNKAFVDSLGCCDQVVLYGDEIQIDNTGPSAYVDMYGDVKLITALHTYIGEKHSKAAW
jgi:hypothetical protein